MKKILIAFKEAAKNKGKPSVVICKTIPGKGVSFMENRFEWHGKAPIKEEAIIALNQICEDECKIRGFDSDKCKEMIKRCGSLE